VDQNTARQLDGMTLERTFTDKASGKDANRPALQEALRYVRRGDTLVVHSMDRLARNTMDLIGTVRDLTGRGVSVEFVKEGQTYSGDDSPMQRLMLGILGSVAQFERELIRERQAEGIAIAKARKAYKGRARKLSPAQAAELRQRAAEGATKAALARDYRISRETVYDYLRAA
jgi:DNA invertase Pin-like site-specific DNA recombinase